MPPSATGKSSTDGMGRGRSTRARPAKAPLSEDAVVDAALEILRSEGAEAVSMRKVAAALDTGPMSLYVYVAGREGLLAAMQARVTAGVDLEKPDPSRWREQVHGLLGRMHRALVAYPGLAASTLAESPTSDAALNYAENMLGLLIAGGLSSQDAAWAADILAMLVTYAAIEDDARRIQNPERAAELQARFSSLPRDRFPLLSTLAEQIVAGTGEERFAFAADVILDGLLARGDKR